MFMAIPRYQAGVKIVSYLASRASWAGLDVWYVFMKYRPNHGVILIFRVTTGLFVL